MGFVILCLNRLLLHYIPYSGLIKIRKHAEQESAAVLFSTISKKQPKM